MEEDAVNAMRRSHKKGTDAIVLAFVGALLANASPWIGIPVLILAGVLFVKSVIGENRAVNRADAQTLEFLRRQEIRRTGFTPVLVSLQK